MSFKKRDRMQIIAEILSSCKKPQTQTYIRRQTNLSHSILQSCIMQLLVKQWLLQIKESCGQKKFAITDKGLVFLDKLCELQNMIQTKNKYKLRISPPNLQTVTVASN